VGHHDLTVVGGQCVRRGLTGRWGETTLARGGASTLRA
jgi:hypothetical protein